MVGIIGFKSVLAGLTLILIITEGKKFSRKSNRNNSKILQDFSTLKTSASSSKLLTKDNFVPLKNPEFVTNFNPSNTLHDSDSTTNLPENQWARYSFYFQPSPVVETSGSSGELNMNFSSNPEGANASISIISNGTGIGTPVGSMQDVSLLNHFPDHSNLVILKLNFHDKKVSDAELIQNKIRRNEIPP